MLAGAERTSVPRATPTNVRVATAVHGARSVPLISVYNFEKVSIIPNTSKVSPLIKLHRKTRPPFPLGMVLHHSGSSSSSSSNNNNNSNNNSSRSSAKRWAALRGVLHESTALVVHMAEPRQWQEWLRVPLYHASATGQASSVSSLLSAGANGGAGFRDHRGSTLLHAAASGGNLAILCALLDAGCGADINIRETQPPLRTPLHCAVSNGHGDMAKALIAAGADPAGVDVAGQTALHLAALSGQTDLVSHLVKLGVDTEAHDTDGNTPLALAVSHGRLETLQLLVRLGASVESRSAKIRHPLGIALKEDRVDCMRALLASGADTEAVDEIGLTALLSATRVSNTEAMSALIEAGADVDGRGGTVWSPLHFAAHVGNVKVIETLVVRGGDLAAKTSLKGSSPLHIAAGHAGVGAVQELLLRWGADEGALDARGQSPWDVAGKLKYVFDRDHRHEEEVRLIQQMLANAPADRNWNRRKGVMMLVNRQRSSAGRERARNDSAAKKRGAEGPGEGGGGGVHDLVAGGGTEKGGAFAKEGKGLEGGMEAFREAVTRLADTDDAGIFRGIIGFI